MPIYDFFVPEVEQESNNRLFEYISISNKEILARYLQHFPELANLPLNTEIRVDVREFCGKVKVNIEFFKVGLSESQGFGGGTSGTIVFRKLPGGLQKFW